MTDAPTLEPLDEHNRRLLSAVRPSDWTNPTPRSRYNLVVVGAGTAGLVAAAGAAGLGAHVALVERGSLGGDCLNTGCVPSKALLRSARAAAEVRAAHRFGVCVPPGASVDFAAVMERMRSLRADLSPHDSAARFRALGVDVFLGSARFVGPDAVEVDGRRLQFTRAIVASGARATRPAIPGLDAAGYLTNETVFNLTALPARWVVVGAGPIGCELAQALARFGSRVTLLATHPRILPREHPEAAALVERALECDGVEIVRSARVERVERAALGDGRLEKRVVVRLPEGPREVAADELLVAVGRTPNVEGLGLDAAGVAHDVRNGIRVDDRLRTTNRRIYAAGDCCSRLRYTHAADAMARLAVQNALFLGRARVSRLVIPHCTYTDPEVAAVGLSRAEAEARGVAVDAFRQDLGRVDRAVLDGQIEGFVEVLVRRGTDRIVGATVVGSHAGEMISELALAIVGGLGLATISRTVHPYPTQAEALKRVGDAWQRTRLTPTVAAWLGRWLAWRR